MARPKGSKKDKERQARLALGGTGKVLGYVRVSTVDQANGHSLAGQVARIRERAAAEGVELVEVIEDVKSGTKQRDGLDEAWARVRAGDVEGLVFGKVDRLGRSLFHLVSLVEEAKENGYSLLSADEGWQVKQGELKNEALPFMLAMAEVERERISRRTREGLAAARAKGVKLGRPVENGAVAERALAMRRKGKTYQAIADTFNGEGLTTARGKQFGPSGIYYIIRTQERQ